MGIFGGYAQRANSYYFKYPNPYEIFKISDINANFLKEHKLNYTVEEFKAMVRKHKPFDYVLTGNACISMRKTAIYRISTILEVENETINI